MSLVLGAAEVLALAGRVGPHAFALHERPLTVVPLVADVHDGVILELHREVVPHAAEHEFALADPVAFRLADGADTPGPVARAPAMVGRDRELLVADTQRPRPPARLRPALGVADDPALAAHVLARLRHGGGVPLPGAVHRDAVLGRL